MTAGAPPMLAKEAEELSMRLLQSAPHPDSSTDATAGDSARGSRSVDNPVEPCPACHGSIPLSLSETESAVCANGHVWGASHPRVYPYWTASLYCSQSRPCHSALLRYLIHTRHSEGPDVHWLQSQGVPVFNRSHFLCRKHIRSGADGRRHARRPRPRGHDVLSTRYWFKRCWRVIQRAS